MAEEEYKEPEGATKISSPKVNIDTICEVCKQNSSKYKCPGCSIRSCSLPCVKTHKQSTGCTGKRQMTQIIPLSQFDDNLLISDYNLLEDVKRVADAAQRKRAKLCGDYLYRLPYPLQNLSRAAARRRTIIWFQSTGMSKRQTNKSYYKKRNMVISWTIEWRFHSTNVILHDHGVDENSSLSSVIMNHLEPSPWNHQLKQFSEEPLQSLKFFIRKYPKGPKQPFLELDIDAPIRQQLANIVIIEYPVIHVFLPSHHYDFEVIKAAIRDKDNLKESISNRELSPKGVPFREEEIKEDISSDPKVLDLMKYSEHDGIGQISHRPAQIKKELTDMLDSSSHATASKQITKDNICSDKVKEEPLDFSVNSTVADIFEKMDFEVEQELIDSYSDLISESILDDIFDLDGEFKKELGLVETNDEHDSCRVFPEEELEEGEIPA